MGGIMTNHIIEALTARTRRRHEMDGAVNAFFALLATRHSASNAEIMEAMVSALGHFIVVNAPVGERAALAEVTSKALRDLVTPR